jgi:hypothetical protein
MCFVEKVEINRVESFRVVGVSAFFLLLVGVSAFCGLELWVSAFLLSFFSFRVVGDEMDASSLRIGVVMRHTGIGRPLRSAGHSVINASRRRPHED